MKNTVSFFARLANPATIRLAVFVASMVVALITHNPDATGGI